MKAQNITWAALISLSVGITGCQKKPPVEAPPNLTIKIAATMDAEPLAGVMIAARGQGKGETGADGTLSFTLTGEPGEEVFLTATLEKPGLKFKPWQQTLVLRKWDRARPETLTYEVAVPLVPVELSAQILVQSGSTPIAGAEVVVEGKSAGRSDANGAVQIPLGNKLVRDVKVAIKFKEHQPFDQVAALRAGETFTASLAKIGAIYGKLTAAYESMGRIVPVPAADVIIGGKAVGKTDATGSVKYESTTKAAPIEIKKEGFIYASTKLEAPARRAAKLTAHLFPREAPTARIYIEPAKSASPGDAEIENVLPEISERLADFVFSHACFERADKIETSDVIISVTASRAEEMLLAVKVATRGGKQLGAFAETAKFKRIRATCEDIAGKVREVFPFEGFVVGVEAGRCITSLGTSKERGVAKGQSLSLSRWDGNVPPKMTAIGKAVIMRAEAETSQAEPQKGAQPVQVGDKAILLPRALEASFDAAVMLKVQAGKEGAEVPFADVNVYRNGVWVGITSDEGELKVPVQTGEKYTFLLVRGGVKPYQVEIQPTQPFEPKTVLVPASMCHVRFESEPSNARLLVDGKEMGSTPLEIDVLMGFRRIRAEAGGDWRAYDEVKEFTKIEEDYTGARKLVLRKDLLKQADNLMAKGDVDGAITALSGAERGHPDYSAIHNRLASIYLDRKKNPQKAIEEFEKVLTLPENAELINKRFTVVFLNEGRAYYMLGTRDGYVKAIARLKTARDNKRFFPQDDFDRATHYTLYYLALATHKLYYLEPGDRLLQEVGTCWKNYFDFFPASLRDDQDILEARTSAEQFSEEIRRKLKEQ